MSLTPLGPNWETPSIIWGWVTLCREDDGSLWLCSRAERTLEWVKGITATPDMVRGIQICQQLAGKIPEPWPEGVPTPAGWDSATI